MERDLVTEMVASYRPGGRYAAHKTYDRAFCSKAVIGVRSPDLGTVPLNMEEWLSNGWIPEAPGLQCLACPYCLRYQAQVRWCYKGQLECLVCGLAVCYADKRPKGAKEAPVLIPAQQALEDGASSYAGDGGDGSGARYKTPSPRSS